MAPREPGLVGDFAPGGMRFTSLIGVLSFEGVLNLAGLWIAAWAAALLTADARLVSLQDLPDDVAIVWGLIRIAQMAVPPTLTLTFSLWLYRAHRNLSAFGARGLRFTPGWAVGWLFVPIFWFFRPAQVMDEIWRASDPQWGRDADNSWRQRPGSLLVPMWWGLMILRGLSYGISSDMPALGVSSMSVVASKCGEHIVGIATVCLSIAVFSIIERRQAERARVRLTHL